MQSETLLNGWGWNPSTFEAVGTVGASVVAVAALSISLAQWKASRVDLLASNARMVTVSFAAARDSAENWDGVTVSVRNEGALPIRIWAMILKVDPIPLNERTDPDREYPPTSALKDCWTVSMHGGLWGRPAEYVMRRKAWPQSIEANATGVIEVETDPGVNLSGIRVQGRTDLYSTGGAVGITFRDAGGIEWTRRVDGQILRGRGLTKRDARRARHDSGFFL